MQKKSIEDVLKAHTPSLMSIQGVIGTAVGEHEGTPCIIVMIAEKTEAVTENIPPTIESYTVRVMNTGDIHARDSED